MQTVKYVLQFDLKLNAINLNKRNIFLGFQFFGWLEKKNEKCVFII